MKYLLGIFILLILYFLTQIIAIPAKKRILLLELVFFAIFPHNKGNEWYGNYLVLNFSSWAAYKKEFQSQKVIFQLLYLNICFYS